MVLVLEITGPQAAPLGSASRKVFGVEGGLIGRDSRNSWVLPHTKVSGRHARISHQSGIFYIEDTSTNGVFINASKNRLGKGRPYALKSGDSIFIDPYVIQVAVSSGDYEEPRSRRASPPPRGRSPQPHIDPFNLEDPFGEQAVPFGEHAVPQPQDPHAEPLSGQEVDPLKLLGGEPARRPAARKAPRAEDLELSSPIRGHYQPPRVVEPPTPPPAPSPVPASPADPFAIPEDYDPLAPATSFGVARHGSPPPALRSPTPPPAPPPPPRKTDHPRGQDVVESTVEADLVAAAPELDADDHERIEEPAAPPVAPPVARPRSSPTPIPAPPPQSDAARAASDAATTAAGPTVDLRSMLEGAGLDPEDVTPDLARSFGEILRVVVSGVMEVLQARHNVKDEFRMRVTQFRPADNNPLKFSANVDDALHNLLVKRNAAYLKPVEAFDDAFDDLRHHQLAMLAGMRTAFETMLNEFHPDRLQEQFDRQVKRGALLGVTARLRYWDLYRDLHEELSKDPEVTFRQLFGDAFAKAYEDQLRRLKAQRDGATGRKPPEEPDI